MLIGTLVAYILTKVFAHETKTEKEISEMIKEEKEVLRTQRFEDYFEKA